MQSYTPPDGGVFLRIKCPRPSHRPGTKQEGNPTSSIDMYQIPVHEMANCKTRGITKAIQELPADFS